MKTRAILQTSPFKSARGQLGAFCKLDGVPFMEFVPLEAEHEDLKPGDTITVERHGSEWRAV